MKEYSDCTWKDNKLFLGDIHWATLKKDKEHKGMWRIWWVGNGELSMDYYNKARAMDNTQKMAVFLYNAAEQHAPPDLK